MMLCIIEVYSLILEYQARAANYLVKSQLSRGTTAIIGGNYWEGLSNTISKLHNNTQRLVS